MYTQVTQTSFENAFMAIRPDNFSYYALEALFDYYEDLEEATGEPIELDVIAICCEWIEETEEDVRANYSLYIDDYPVSDDVLQFLQNRTDVTKLDNGNYLYSQF